MIEKTEVLTISAEVFDKMIKMDVSEYTKVLKTKSVSLDYIPWSSCVYLMKMNFPTFVFKTLMFPTAEGVLLPYYTLPDGSAIIETVILDTSTGKESLPSCYPVMEGFGKKAVIDPDARNINDNIQRSRAKTLAEVTGIGLNLWMRIEVEAEENPSEEVKRPPATVGRGKPKVEEEEEEYEEEESEVFDEPKKTLSRTTRPASTGRGGLFSDRKKASPFG